MELNDAIWKVNQVIPNIDKNRDFYDRLIGGLNDPKSRNIIIDPDSQEVDINCLAFLWWVYKGEAAHINDFLHGFYWSMDGKTGAPINEESHFAKVLAADPIVQAERIKIKDYYVKHTNWVYHKTQDLPKITIIGRENVAGKQHLRQVVITVLDPQVEFPEKCMFPDHGQRKRYRTIDSYAIFDVMETKDYKMIGTQNAVIIDDERITLDKDRLKEKIIAASSYLTMHGRCLFDIPLYDHREILMASDIYRLVRPFISPREIGPTSPKDLNAVDAYVHNVVDDINQSEYLMHNKLQFEIEELKLTNVGLNQSVGARIYLKLVKAP